MAVNRVLATLVISAALGWAAAGAREADRLPAPECWLESPMEWRALRWREVPGAAGYRVYQGETRVAELGPRTAYSPSPKHSGVHSYRVVESVQRE